MAMHRRANGEGYIRWRSDGRWEASLAWIDPESGRMQRKSFYAKTSTDVRAKLRKARQRLDTGRPVTDATLTVSQWLQRWRATTLAASDRRPTTREGYTILSRRHLEPRSEERRV